MASVPSAQELRQLLLTVFPEDTSLHGAAPDVRFTYVPASHIKALQSETMLVVGMRGAGKSYWSGALQDPAHRALLARQYPRLGLTQETEVVEGFSERIAPTSYPSQDVLAKLLESGVQPAHIWRTVIARALAPRDHPLADLTDWASRVGHVAGNPETIDLLLAERDGELEVQGRGWLMVFDALDRSASTWAVMNELIRGLLQIALSMRSFRRLRVKVFLRTDQLESGEVTSFVDASKLLSSKVELTWPSRELFNLLWHYLANAEDQPARDFIERVGRVSVERVDLGGSTIYFVGRELSLDEDRQRETFHAITGPWMGRDRRRGFPYTWIPGHLADAQGRTSPRTFVAALRHAAVDSDERRPATEHALHYESIKRGVQEASKIRVAELQEDYPWIAPLMSPLQGEVVPCKFRKVSEIWSRPNGPLEQLRERVAGGGVRLPPTRLEEGADGVRADLEALGLFLRLGDGRLNIPDVFRVGYGLGRKGGVPPIRSGEPA